MTLDLRAALVVFVLVAAWRFARRRRHEPGEQLPDVPDAPTGAVAAPAPGMALPYSSLDPTAPPKRAPDGTRIDGLPDDG